MFIDGFNRIAYELLENNLLNNKTNILLIYGPEGVGKTTLVKEILKKNLLLNDVVYVDALTFSKQYIYAVQNNTLTRFRSKYRNAKLLVIDQLEVLEGKIKTIEELRNTVHDVLQGKGRVIGILRGDLTKLDALDKKFSSFFLSGLVLTINPPKLEELFSFSSYYQRSRFIVMEAEAQRDLVRNACNLKDIKNLVDSFITFAENSGEALTKYCFKEFWDKELARRESIPSTENILHLIISLAGISIEDITGNKRSNNILRARQLAVYALKNLMGFSYSEVGRILNREHSAIIKSYKQAAVNVIEDKNFKYLYEQVLSKFPRQSFE